MAEKILASVAIVVATVAFLFGGYFNASWTKEVSKPDLSVVVEDVQIEVESDVGERLIGIPVALQARTSNAKYFPTLAPVVRRNDIERYIEMGHVHDRAVPELRLAAQRLSSDGRDEHARQVWNAISTDSRSLLLSFRTARIRSQSLDASQFVEPFLAGESGSIEERVLRDPATQLALKETSDLVFAVDELTSERVLDAIEDDIDAIESAALEYGSVIGELVQVLQQDLDRNQPTAWKVNAVVYNAGSVADSMHAIGALSVRRSTSDDYNKVLLVEGADPNEKVVVPPGGVAHIELGTVQDPSELDEWFSLGDKDFVLSMATLSGEHITSQAYPFSIKHSQTRENLEQFAQDVAVPIATGG